VVANVPVQTTARAVTMGFIQMDHIAEVNVFFYYFYIEMVKRFPAPQQGAINI